jgi:hypothetical protein
LLAVAGREFVTNWLITKKYPPFLATSVNLNIAKVLVLPSTIILDQIPLVASALSVSILL